RPRLGPPRGRAPAADRVRERTEHALLDRDPGLAHGALLLPRPPRPSVAAAAPTIARVAAFRTPAARPAAAVDGGPVAPTHHRMGARAGTTAAWDTSGRRRRRARPRRPFTGGATRIHANRSRRCLLSSPNPHLAPQAQNPDVAWTFWHRSLLVSTD